MKKYFLVLILLTLGVYGNVLLNGFTGDDHAIIVDNTFYSKLSNLSKLFSKEYTTNPSLLNRGPGKDYGSGSVAYRPVLSFTYFIDNALWGKKAVGYHLTNLGLHTVNVLLVFMLFLVFMSKSRWAFFSAMLFSIHPIHTEVLCAVGYRADLLATFFVLIGCLSWIRFRQSRKIKWGLFTLLAYFLAVFSKESAILFPLLLWTYDWLYVPESGRKGSLYRWGGAFLSIWVFYIWVYLWVFPNPSLYANIFFGKSLTEHLSVVLRIWEFNFFSLFFPWSITAIPPLYSFPPLPLNDIWLIFSFVLSMLVVGRVCFCLNKNNSLVFWLGWFFLFYIPVCGIIATPNPVAYRFLYLPSIGFLGIAGYCLCQILEMSIFQGSGQRLSGWLRFLIIGACCICTFFNNFLWKDNVTISKQWVKDYPGYYKGYLVLGIEYFRRSKFAEAVETLELYWHDFRMIDVTALFCLAEGHFQLGHMSRAEYFFNEIIKLYPNYSDGYFGLGQVYLELGDSKRAFEYFSKAIDIESKDMYFKYPLARSRKLRKDQKTASIVVELLKNRYGEQFVDQR